MFDPPNAPVGYFRQIDPDRQPFPTKDGYISIVIYTDEAIAVTFRMLGNPEFLDDERFATRKQRTANFALIYRQLASLTANFTTAELLDRCRECQLPAQAVRDIGDIMDDPHLKATGFFEARKHPTEGDYFAMAHPVRFDQELGGSDRLAPTLGQHTGEVR